MRKILFSLFAMVMGIAAFAQTELKITFPMTDQTSISAYKSEWTGKDVNGDTWTIVNFNNNKNGWAYIKCGWKTEATTSTITSPVIKEAVTEYAVTVDATSSVTSSKLEVLKSDGTTVVESQDLTMAKGDVKVTLTGTENAIYRITIENPKTSSNGTTQISAITLTKKVSGPVYTWSATDKNGKEVNAKFATSPLTVKLAEYAEGMTFKVNDADATYNAETGLTITSKSGSKTNDTYKVDVYSSDGTALTSKVYTWIPTATSVSTLKAFEDGTEAILAMSNAKVTYVDGTQKNVYIQDATRGILCYDLGLTGFEAYKQTAVNIWGKKTTYKSGVVQFQRCDSTASSTITPSATVVDPTAKTVAQTLLADNQLTYVKVSGAKIVLEGTTYYAVAGSDKVMLYDSFKTNLLKELATTPCYADITGIITIYNGTIELLPVALANVADKIQGTCGTVTYTIDLDGNMVFKPTEGETGTLAKLGTVATARPWSGVASVIKTVKFEGSVATVADPSYMFKEMTNLESVDFTNFNTADAITMKGLFQSCASLKTVDLSGLNVANVANYTQIFDGCKALETIDMRNVSTLALSKSSKADNMFANGCAPSTLYLSKNFGPTANASYITLPTKKYMAVDETGKRIAGKDFDLPTDQAALYAYNATVENYGTYVAWQEKATLTVGATGYATAAFREDVTIPADVEAYVVAGIQENGTTLTLTKLDGVIPAVTGVIIKAAASSSLEFAPAASAAPAAVNLLKPAFKGQNIPAAGYVLQNQAEKGLGFYKLAADRTAEKDCAYLSVANAAVKAFFFGEEATAIQSILSGKAEIYDLQGRKLNKLEKGINIVNGKKIMVK